MRRLALTGVPFLSFISPIYLSLIIGFTPVLSLADNSHGSTANTRSVAIQTAPPILIVRSISINAGGGESSDGILVVRGTLGQAVAGDMHTCRRNITSDQWSISSEINPDQIWANSFEFDPACE